MPLEPDAIDHHLDRGVEQLTIRSTSTLPASSTRSTPGSPSQKASGRSTTASQASWRNAASLE